MKKLTFTLAILLTLLAGCTKKETAAEQKPVINITVTQTKSNDILFTTECSDPNVSYYVYGMTKTKYLQESTYSADSIMGFEKSWYEMLGQGTGDTWYEALLKDCVKGKQSWQFTDFTAIIEPETELVIYAYAINDKGERLSYICTCQVATAAMNRSSNQIAVNITNVYANGVDADFTTTNGDSYYISLQRKVYVDYFQTEGHTLGEMAADLLVDELSNSGKVPLQSGDHSITPAEYSCKQANTDYYLIYFAYDNENGRRSDVYLVPFHTAEAE